MRVTVNVPDSVAEAARCRGLAVRSYIERLVENSGRRDLIPDKMRTPEDIAAFFEKLAADSEKIPQFASDFFFAREYL